MPDTWILASKLEPPEPPTPWIRRAALLDAAAPVVVLEAGPGYGKTLGLLELATAAGASGSRLLWLTLEADDAGSLFHYLAAGLARTVPKFGTELLAMVGAGAPPRALWQRLIADIGAFDLLPLVIVLDDVHQVDGALLRELATCFERLPPGLQFFMSTRKRFPAPLTKAIGRGKARVLGAEALAFAPAEAERYLSERAPLHAARADWRERCGRLGGWPLGLEFLAASPDNEVVTRPGAGVERLTAYIAEELFRGLPPAIQKFALAAASLQELTPEACREVFGVADAADTLTELEGEHLLQRLASGVAYRVPEHLRGFLALEAERVVPAAERDGWHRRAAAYYQARGQAELAIPHLVAARDWQPAGAACGACFPQMRFDGRGQTIALWLAAFPHEALEADPWLSLWQGHALGRAGKLPEALTCYERAQALFAKAGDAAGQFKVLVCRCNVALNSDDEAGYTALAQAAQALAGDARPEDLADMHLIRGQAAEGRGELTTMRRCNEAVLALPIGHDIDLAASHSIALFNLFTHALHTGSLREAREHIDQAVHTASEWGFWPYQIFGRFMQAHLLLLTGESLAAATVLDALPAGWQELLDWHDLACAYVVIGFQQQGRGEWKEAEDALRKAAAIFKRAGHLEGLKVPLERQLWLALYRGQFARLDQLLADSGLDAGESVYDFAMALPLARARQLEGLPARALAILEGAIAGLERLQANHLLAQARLLEAAAARANDDPARASRALDLALGLIESHDYVFLLGQDAALWAELDPLLSACRARFPFLERVPGLEGRLAPPPAQALAPVATTRLSLHCFGGLEVRANGLLLDQWARRKAKLVLAALAVYPRGLSLAELADVTGDSEADNLTTYKVAVSALRRTLEPEIEKAGAYRCIKLVGERYMLSADCLELVDVKAFERGLDEGDRLWSEAPDEAAGCYRAALALYRGHLLDEPYLQNFFEAEREGLRERARGAFLRLAAHPRVAPSEAAKLLARATELMPEDEAVCAAVIRFHDARGDLERARQAYWDCRRALKTRLGVTPSLELEAVYRGVREAPALKRA